MIPIKFQDVYQSEDWGYFTTTVEGVTRDLTFGTAGSKSSLPRSGKVLVKFPDGSMEEVEVFLRLNVEHVNDMGHEYSVTSWIPYIKLKTHGLTVEISLATRGLQVQDPWPE